MLMAPRRTHEQQRWCQRATGREVMGAQAGNVPRPSQLYLTDRWSVGQLTSDPHQAQRPVWQPSVAEGNPRVSHMGRPLFWVQTRVP